MADSPAETYSVLIVEDRIHTAKNLARDIERHPRLSVVDMVHDVGTALAYLPRYKPRFILVDLGLPGGSGVDIIKAAQSGPWECDCIVISIFGDEYRVLDAIRAGAKGYILKNDPYRNIGKQIMDILDGGSPMSPKIARLLLKIAQKGFNPRIPEIDDQPALTAREMDVLRHLSSGFKRREIAERLSVSTGTVSTHINNIYSKLGVNSNVEAIFVASSKKLL